MAEQLPILLSTQTHASFDNFHGGGASCPAVALLQSMRAPSAPKLLYLWGGAGAGKSHLLHACCRLLESEGWMVHYLPLTLYRDQPIPPLSLLEGLDQGGMILVDDVEAVAGEPKWEELLFHLLNQARDQQQSVVVTSQHPLSELAISLPDLRSRLGEAVSEYLQPLTAEEKWVVIQQRAHEQGMEIGDEVVNYLINRTSRDFDTLFTLLEQLDRETLAKQRKITIPFVKELLRL